MKRVLVLGGYGTFGGRIAARGAAAGFEMLVAGRSLARAEAFCAGRSGLVPVSLDGGLAECLARHRPFALVDAAGPFQGAEYGTARAALAAGCHYLDIADGSDFVAGIAALDGEARRAGVCAISGASSVPALSGAVARHLARGLERVTVVEIALSASSRGTSGRSVAAAILSYLGRPVRLRRGGRWDLGIGWQELRRKSFAVEGAPPLRGRLVALADVPDLILMPDRLPDRPAVTFLAGTDAPWHNLGLWLLSWPVRLGWPRRPERLAGLLSTLQRLTRGPGSLRSAFEIRMFGVAGGRRLERRWTLIAERGDGPEIPSLAVPLLLSRLAAGGVAPGARDSGSLLSLEDFQPALAAIAAAHGTTERPLPPPLYARVMGERFEVLPPAVRKVHEVLRDGGASGEAEVGGAANPVGRLLARMLGFPAEGRHRLHVAFAERDGVERWTRDFSGRRFTSELGERGGRLTERFGPVRFAFDLPSDSRGLEMIVCRWWLGPVPLPLFLAPRADAREWEEDGRFRFDVAIALPAVGRLVHYRGWLSPAEGLQGRP